MKLTSIVILRLLLSLSPLTLAMPAMALADYIGSSFNEVREVVMRKPIATTAEEAEEMDVYNFGGLPHYEVSATKFVVDGFEQLLHDAKLTLSDRVDYYPRLAKLLHPNGVCFTGTWQITEPTNYTGYFAQGAQGLFMARGSVALSETEQGHNRGFGFAGKIFPTTNPDQRVKTANFFTLEVLLGTKADHFLDTAWTNEPPTGFDWSTIGLGIETASILSKADSHPTFRPTYPIAELGVPAGAPVRAPHWMRIRPVAGTPRFDEKDFRNELMMVRYPGGITLEIAVSETTHDRNATTGWTTIGHIQLRESKVSYGCDRQLHFHHMTFKNPNE